MIRVWLEVSAAQTLAAQLNIMVLWLMDNLKRVGKIRASVDSMNLNFAFQAAFLSIFAICSKDFQIFKVEKRKCLLAYTGSFVLSSAKHLSCPFGVPWSSMQQRRLNTLPNLRSRRSDKAPLKWERLGWSYSKVRSVWLGSHWYMLMKLQPLCIWMSMIRLQQSEVDLQLGT